VTRWSQVGGDPFIDAADGACRSGAGEWRGDHTPRWWAGTVLVIVDPTRSPDRPLEKGILLARTQARRLAVVGLVADPPLWVGCSPAVCCYSWQSLRAEGIEEATKACLQLVRGVPADLPVTFAVLPGRPRRALNRLVSDSGDATVVLPREWVGTRRVAGCARRGIDLCYA
jgi:hypothetical protein